MNPQVHVVHADVHVESQILNMQPHLCLGAVAALLSVGQVALDNRLVQLDTVCYGLDRLGRLLHEARLTGALGAGHLTAAVPAEQIAQHIYCRLAYHVLIVYK